MSVADEGYEDLDFEALESAVRQSPKGSWFLDEYARRLRGNETSNILDAIARLERIISSQGHVLEAPAANPPMPAKQLRYFNQDEEIFEEAKPAPTVAAVASAPLREPKLAGSAAAEHRGARLKILRMEQPAVVAGSELPPDASSAAASVPHESQPETEKPHPTTAAALQSAANRHRQRIVISRHATPEALAIPLVEEPASAPRG